jgi:biotin synthase
MGNTLSARNQNSGFSTMTRYDWTLEDIREVYEQPFPELLFKAQLVHRESFSPTVVQRSTLLSVKTGGCPENCSYCPQSAHYDTGVDRHKVLPKDYVMQQAKEAKENGSTRFCMGAAWREIRDGSEFDAVIDLVEGVHSLGLEVCCTLGMLNEKQAARLKDAGCHAYNHNLDTSPEYYGEIISTRTYQDRLDTLKNVRKAGITVCCGGIVGMGEQIDDRLGLLLELSKQDPHPESVPINMLVRVEGTPLTESEDVDPIDFVRIIATARIVMPKSYVRLSAGRTQMSDEMQALCFLAGANSIFAGEKLLTTPNPGEDKDHTLMRRLGMEFKSETNGKSKTPSCGQQAPAAQANS